LVQRRLVGSAVDATSDHPSDALATANREQMGVVNGDKLWSFA
jgi:hypothetical protein